MQLIPPLKTVASDRLAAAAGNLVYIARGGEQLLGVATEEQRREYAFHAPNSRRFVLSYASSFKANGALIVGPEKVSTASHPHSTGA